MLNGVPADGFEGREGVPLIAGIPPELPGIVIGPPFILRFGLPLPALVPKGSVLGAAPVELGEPRGLVGAPASEPVPLFEVFPCESRCMPWSALPPA